MAKSCKKGWKKLNLLFSPTGLKSIWQGGLECDAVTWIDFSEQQFLDLPSGLNQMVCRLKDKSARITFYRVDDAVVVLDVRTKQLIEPMFAVLPAGPLKQYRETKLFIDCLLSNRVRLECFEPAYYDLEQEFIVKLADCESDHDRTRCLAHFHLQTFRLLLQAAITGVMQYIVSMIGLINKAA